MCLAFSPFFLLILDFFSHALQPKHEEILLHDVTIILLIVSSPVLLTTVFQNRRTMSRQYTSLYNRIRDNDSNLTEANLGFEGDIDIPQLTAIFDALCENTAVKYSAVRVGAFLKLDKSAYDGFARMLSKNKVIEKLTLYLQRQKEIDQLMKAFKDHGDGICLKTINLYMFGLVEATDMSTVVDFLTRWPKAACKVEIRARDGGTNSIIDPEKFLKEIVAAHIESLTLVGNCCSLKAVAAAMKQPYFRLKGLSISFSDYESTPLFATALEACKSIVSFEMRERAGRHVLARLPAMQNIEKFSVVGLSSCLSLRPVCQAIRAHGNIKTLKLKWEPGWQYEDDEDTAHTTFTPADFEGLEKLILKFTCPLVPGDRGISIFNAAVETW